MISSYKGAMLEICRILSEAQENAKNHSPVIKAAILDGAITVALYTKDSYLGRIKSKPTYTDPGEWHSIFDEEENKP